MKDNKIRCIGLLRDDTRHNVIEALLLKLTGYVSQHLQEPHEEGLARDVRTDQL